MRLKKGIYLAIWVTAFGLFSIVMSRAQSSFQGEKMSVLAPFLTDNPSESASSNFSNLLSRLEKKRIRKSDENFLKSVFYLTQRKLLSEYQKTATMQETLESGVFGCLTGTAIYAAILNYFDFNTKIIELPNHVFLIVQTERQSYLFESTMPNGGFMKTNEKLDALLEQPWLHNRNILSLEVVGKWYDNDVLSKGFTTIELNDLAGLQYFNKSVESYQNQDYLTAMDMSLEAYQLYPSKRNEKMMQLVINKILKQELIIKEVKDKYIQTYVKLIKTNKLSQTK